ncbi:uncharacterized protein LOC143233395 [Tachypleus tridentatus]|uniref:uncharacterized protein LOC143233395 n=1 Tax=Tachypleus tridentatus TaxID=6853 RepID=UPI003FD1D2D2
MRQEASLVRQGSPVLRQEPLYGRKGPSEVKQESYPLHPIQDPSTAKLQQLEDDRPGTPLADEPPLEPEPPGQEMLQAVHHDEDKGTGNTIVTITTRGPRYMLSGITRDSFRTSPPPQARPVPPSHGPSLDRRPPLIHRGPLPQHVVSSAPSGYGRTHPPYVSITSGPPLNYQVSANYPALARPSLPPSAPAVAGLSPPTYPGQPPPPGSSPLRHAPYPPPQPPPPGVGQIAHPIPPLGYQPAEKPYGQDSRTTADQMDTFARQLLEHRSQYRRKRSLSRSRSRSSVLEVAPDLGQSLVQDHGPFHHAQDIDLGHTRSAADREVDLTLAQGPAPLDPGLGHHTLGLQNIDQEVLVIILGLDLDPGTGDTDLLDITLVHFLILLDILIFPEGDHLTTEDKTSPAQVIMVVSIVSIHHLHPLHIQLLLVSP